MSGVPDEEQRRTAGILKDLEATNTKAKEGYEATAFHPGTAIVSWDEYVQHDSGHQRHAHVFW